MSVFKQCPKCRHAWMSREAFLADPEIALVGYQVHFEELTAGILLFNHHCRTTLALPALVFKDLYRGPIFTERATGGADCPGHCLRQEDLDPCPTHCECAFVRHVLQTIKTWPKHAEQEQ